MARGQRHSPAASIASQSHFYLLLMSGMPAHVHPRNWLASSLSASHCWRFNSCFPARIAQIHGAHPGRKRRNSSTCFESAGTVTMPTALSAIMPRVPRTGTSCGEEINIVIPDVNTVHGGSMYSSSPTEGDGGKYSFFGQSKLATVCRF